MTNYALEWYQYGLQKDDDPIVKFMFHWIAFNWLYSEYRYGGEVSEVQAIRQFCRVRYKELSKFKAFRTTEVNVFLEGPVRSIAGGEVTSEGTNIYRDLVYGEGLTRLTSLLVTIYRVRCNLFHGSKSLRIERDRNLVRAASVILEGYLKEVLKDNL